VKSEVNGNVWMFLPYCQMTRVGSCRQSTDWAVVAKFEVKMEVMWIYIAPSR